MAFGLEGIKVIETATVFAAPMAGRLLADWGADVIKVGNPQRADSSQAPLERTRRTTGRPVAAIPSPIPYAPLNTDRNKRAITLNLSQEAGRQVMSKLLETADVFLNNYLPRVLKNLKLEYETLSQLNPRLIQANLTSFGKKGPLKDAGAVDYVGFWQRSGVMHLLMKPGTTPLLTPGGMGDRTSALALALGIMTALYVREKTGVGQEVDVSLFQSGVFVVSDDVGGSLVTGQDLQPFDRKDAGNAIATYYQTKDGRWLRLGMRQPDLFWSRFCQAIERPDLEHDPRFETTDLKLQNQAALFDVLEQVFSTKTLAEWEVRLSEAEVHWAPVHNLPELTTDPQARANDFFVAYDHPSYGRIELVANPIHLSQTQETVRMPNPEFGQHTEEVLLEYGYTWEDIGRFKEQGVIA